MTVFLKGGFEGPPQPDPCQVHSKFPSTSKAARIVPWALAFSFCMEDLLACTQIHRPSGGSTPTPDTFEKRSLYYVALFALELTM